MPAPTVLPLPQNRDRKGAAQSTYLITFVCYGTWLPGQPGAVDNVHNQFGSRLPEANPDAESKARERMVQPPYLLDAPRRQIVLEAIRQVCVPRDWILLAAHVRTNHVHTVIAAEESAEHVMNTL